MPVNAAAYCRVSTNKDEQLDSLCAQQRFFAEYAARNGFTLAHIYADEGKSGTKMKNRTELLRLLTDAGRHMFDVVLIKDVSRLARNTVDFLTSVRRLKTLGVKVVFVNYDQTSSESSEFMLTMLSAIAQEESANTSKRVKFGKRMNAEKGRVPNLVFGYDKTPGDIFRLTVNQTEAETVRLVFDMYANKSTGASKIAAELNRRAISTKRGCKWSQNAVSRILTNRIYIGEVINGKQEVEDFLTGKRREKDTQSWLVASRPELRLIDDETFLKAGRILASRSNAFKTTGERASERHVFSKLINCPCCGSSFRRQVRAYNDTRIKWVCAGRNANGADYCPNKTVIDEAGLLDSICSYFAGILEDKPGTVKAIARELERRHNAASKNEAPEKTLATQLEKAKRRRRKYIEMYEMEIITAQELKSKTAELSAEIERLNGELKLFCANASEPEGIEAALKGLSGGIGSILQSEMVTNNMLRRIIGGITAGEAGNVEVYIKPLSEISGENAVPFSLNNT